MLSKRRSERTISLGAYNLYNQQNPFFYFYRRETPQAAPTLYQFTLFPVLPSVSGSWAF
ncbi:MAG: hypothetical protein SF053_16530 [Bacteroidia bacterium]|nr:hypothetical protein [Bacteroidia bacterium]